MEVTFIGVGSAFSRRNANSNLLVESGDVKLAIDCGHSFSESLQGHRVSLNDLTHVLVTHLHADHIGGLEEVAIMCKFIFCKKMKIIGTQTLLDRLWECSLSGGLEYIESTPGDLTPQTLAHYFDVMIVEEGEWFSIDQKAPLQLRLQATDHVKGMESYSIQFTEDPKYQKRNCAIFSGDVKFDSDMVRSYVKENKHVFHDCQIYDSGENNSYGVHTSYNQLLSLPKSVRKHLWLYHYGDDPLPNSEGDGFKGFVQHHQSFEI